MVEPAAEVFGGRQLRKALKEAGPEYVDELKDVNQELGEVVAKDARALVPERSGRLRTTIKAGRVAGGAKVSAGRKSVPYAGVIHFGNPHTNIEPQPFLYDALDGRRDEVLAAYHESLNKVLDKAGLR